MFNRGDRDQIANICWIIKKVGVTSQWLKAAKKSSLEEMGFVVCSAVDR